jgi:serine/threonine protein kinase
MIGPELDGTYCIYDKVGLGGFATVYLGRNLNTNEVVAIKVHRQEYTEDPKFVKRFLREAQLAETLQHPNVVCMLGCGVEGDVHYPVMEYVEGKTLNAIIAERGALPAEDAVSIASQVCLALEAAWQANVVRRDIKPHNLMLTPGGVVKVMDFGIAWMSDMPTLTETGMFIGTPRYLPPEVARGEKADIRSDIYALEIVLYEMLTGNTPFVADSPWAVLHHQIETPAPALRSQLQDIPAWLDAAVARALAKDRDQRFQTPSEMLAALGKGGTVLPTVTGPLPTPRPKARPQRRNLWPLIVAPDRGRSCGRLDSGSRLWFAAGPGLGPGPVLTEPPVAVIAAASAETLAPTETPPSEATSTPLPATATWMLTPLPPATTNTPVVVVVVATPTPLLQPTSSPTEPTTPTSIPSPEPTATELSAPTLAPTEPSVPTPAPTARVAEATPTLQAVALSTALTGRIAFSVSEPGSGKYTLYRVSADGKDLRWLGDHLRQPSCGQDGNMLVTNGQEGGMDDLWKVKPDGSGAFEALGQPGDEHPIWLQSPEAYYVGFGSTCHGDGHWRIYRENDAVMSGSGAVRGRFPVWLPVEAVAYSGCDHGFGSGSKCGLFRVSMWGGVPVRLLDDPTDIPTGGGVAGVLFMRQVDGNWDVYLVGPGGGVPRRLTDHAAQDGLATFSPDGKAIAFLSNRSSVWAIWLMAPDGANQRKLLNLPGNPGTDRTSERLSWGPMPVAAAAGPTPVGGELLPAPQLIFPIPEDRVSLRRPPTVRWSWGQNLAANQGFEVRFWHDGDPSPMGVASPTTAQEQEVDLTDRGPPATRSKHLQPGGGCCPDQPLQGTEQGGTNPGNARSEQVAWGRLVSSNETGQKCSSHNP